MKGEAFKRLTLGVFGGKVCFLVYLLLYFLPSLKDPSSSSRLSLPLYLGITAPYFLSSLLTMAVSKPSSRLPFFIAAGESLMAIVLHWYFKDVMALSLAFFPPLLTASLSGHKSSLTILLGNIGSLFLVKAIQGRGLPQGSEFFFTLKFWFVLAVFGILYYLALLISRYLEEHRRAEGLLTLIHIGRELGGTLDMQKISAILVDVLKRIVNCHSCGLYVIEEKDGEKMVVLKSVETPYPQTFFDFNLDVPKSIFPSVIKERRYAKIPDLRKIEEQMVPKARYFRSLLVVPVVFEQEVLGMLFAVHSIPDLYTQEDLELITLLADQFAITLKNVRLYQTTEKMAITDSLTGLYTHGYFQDSLVKELVKAKYENKPLSLVVLDVDFFKIVNDTHGHPQGDYVLRQMAGLIRSTLRPLDIVARYGGDEFVITMPGLDRMNSAVFAERVRKAIEDYTFVADSKAVKISISAGVASFPESAQTAKELVEVADKALYEAKHRGRNKVVYL